MNRITVCEQNDAKVSTFHLRYLCPAANTSIFLNHFLDWLVDGPLYPRFLDYGAIWTVPYHLKVFRELNYPLSPYLWIKPNAELSGSQKRSLLAVQLQ